MLGFRENEWVLNILIRKVTFSSVQDIAIVLFSILLSWLLAVTFLKTLYLFLVFSNILSEGVKLGVDEDCQEKS